MIQETKTTEEILFPTNALFSAYKKYGIHRSQLQELLVKQFVFPIDYKDCLLHYYILYWEPEYFFSQLKDGNILRNGVTYLVVYTDQTPEAIKKRTQIGLSFREPQKEFGLPSYVLVG